MDDALNLARGGLMNFILAFETIEFLVNETHYSPWVAAFNNFAYIGDRFKPHEIEVFKVLTNESASLSETNGISLTIAAGI